MADTSLKQLAKAYATGEITKYDYRQQRSTVIDEITGYSDIVEETETDTSPLTVPFAAASEQTPNTPQNTPPQKAEFTDGDISFDFDLDPLEEDQPQNISQGLRLIFIITVLTFIVFAFILLYPQPSPDTTTTPVSDSALTADPRQLVESFVNKTEWAQSDIAEFLINWLSLSEQQQNKAQQEVWFQRLVDTLRKRQIEQKALADLGTAEAQQKETQIKLLAESLDIYL